MHLYYVLFAYTSVVPGWGTRIYPPNFNWNYVYAIVVVMIVLLFLTIKSFFKRRKE